MTKNNKYVHFTTQDDATIMQLFMAGKPVSEVAQTLNRTRISVLSRYQRLQRAGITLVQLQERSLKEEITRPMLDGKELPELPKQEGLVEIKKMLNEKEQEEKDSNVEE